MPKVSAPPAVSLPPAAFAPPPVELGQVVLWTAGPGNVKPTPAVVIAVATNSVSLAIHVDGTRDHIMRYGVRHKDDPFLANRPMGDQGVWDLTPRDRKINALLESFAPVEE